VHEAAPDAKPWLEVDPMDIKQKASNAKKRLCNDAAAQMTLVMLKERDPEGEIDDLLKRIAGALR
jgi:hypothetical protein